MSIFRIIDVLLQGTFTILAAAITNIGWFKSSLTDFLHEFRTVVITLVTDTAFDSGIRSCTGCTTDFLRFTCYPVYTGIIRVIGITAFEVMSILLDLFCYSSSILSKLFCDCSKGLILTKTFLDCQTIFKG